MSANDDAFGGSCAPRRGPGLYAGHTRRWFRVLFLTRLAPSVPSQNTGPTASRSQVTPEFQKRSHFHIWSKIHCSEMSLWNVLRRNNWNPQKKYFGEVKKAFCATVRNLKRLGEKIEFWCWKRSELNFKILCQKGTLLKKFPNFEINKEVKSNPKLYASTWKNINSQKFQDVQHSFFNVCTVEHLYIFVNRYFFKSRHRILSIVAKY